MKLFPKIIGIGLVGLFISVVISVVAIYSGTKLQMAQDDSDKIQLFRTKVTEAKEAHLLWRMRISAAIINAAETLAVQGNHKLCDFGKWYYSEEARQLVVDMPSDVQTRFGNLEPGHTAVHQTGGQLIDLWNKDDMQSNIAFFQKEVIPKVDAFVVELDELRNETNIQAQIVHERVAGLVRNQSIAIWSALGLGAIVLLLYSWFTASGIVTPLRKITKAATELADGNLEIDVAVKTKDETAMLAAEFLELAHSLKGKTEVALAIARGDLTVWVPLSSDEDRLGKCLVRMRYSLYDSIKGLKGLAESISVEATSLAQVNQTLLDNSTHSSEQLKDISESIRSLHTQTEQNAGSARNAENLTKSAMDGSNDGREKMGRMVQAMETITKGSDEIKKIIRVIDDIAFQTNLLALNAAVEAARAGQHGKGFAVVAEEVRNLAARSAKAAKETADLIEESIRQVGLGSGVAHETSTSLNVITDQVEQINKIVSTISEESDHQAKHLGGMTDTVGQVSAGADATMHSISNVTEVIASINKTAGELEEIVIHFKANPGGQVMLAGHKYPGFVPGHGAFRNM